MTESRLDDPFYYTYSEYVRIAQRDEHPRTDNHRIPGNAFSKTKGVAEPSFAESQERESKEKLILIK